MARQLESGRSEPPLVQRRIALLIDALPSRSGVGLTASELAGASGLRPQQVALALSALEMVGSALRSYDAPRRRYVWCSAPARRPFGRAPSSVASPLRTVYTVAEAASLTGRTEKALRRRIERGSLRVQRQGRFLYVSHGVLQISGLIDGRVKMTHTARGVREIIDLLRTQPRPALSTWKLSSESVLSRQAADVVLAALTVVGYVERQAYGGVAWRWIGP